MTEQTQGTPENKALAVRGMATALVPYGTPKEVKEMARRIMALDRQPIRMGPGEASLLAEVAIAHSLDPFMGEVWGWVAGEGPNRKFTIMPGRRGILRHAHEQAKERGTHFWPKYRELVDMDERANLKVAQGDLAFECRVFDHKSVTTYTALITALKDAGFAPSEIRDQAGDPPFVFGLGLLTKQEMDALDKSRNKMTHVERCQKRAYMMALRQLFTLPLATNLGPGGQTVDDYILEGEWREVPATDEADPGPDPDEIASRSAKGSADLFGPDDTRARQVPGFWPPAVLREIVVAGLARNDFGAAGALAYSPFDKDVTIGPAMTWVGKYRKHRDLGNNPILAGKLATEELKAQEA